MYDLTNFKFNFKSTPTCRKIHPEHISFIDSFTLQLQAEALRALYSTDANMPDHLSNRIFEL